MFEKCKDIAELNQERIAMIRSGNPAVVVNKAYAQRKADLLSTQTRGFTRVPFYPASASEPEQIIAIQATWTQEDPYTLLVYERM